MLSGMAKHRPSSDVIHRGAEHAKSGAKTAGRLPARGARAVWGAYGWFLVSTATAIAFLGVVWWVPGNPWTDGLQIGLAVAYGLSFLALLLTRLKRVYKGQSVWLEGALAGVATLGTLAVFALCYKKAGILDSTVQGGATSYAFVDCLYLSVCTFTTVGFGDFSPLGIGRATGSVQALLGYVTLGLIASTAASIMQEQAEEELDGDDED